MLIKGTSIAQKVLGVPYVQGILEALLQQDNPRPHVTTISVECLAQANVTTLPWPPLSPN